MSYCPYCGSKTDFGAKFCPSCGKSLVEEQISYEPRHEYRPPPPRYSNGPRYDEGICCLLCCCLGPFGPIAALLYYLFTEHEPQYSNYDRPPY